MGEGEGMRAVLEVVGGLCGAVRNRGWESLNKGHLCVYVYICLCMCVGF